MDFLRKITRMDGISEKNTDDNLVREPLDNVISFFFLFLFICGLILIVLTPPLAIPDENVHFVNAYTVSRGDIFTDYNELAGKMGKPIPLYISDFVDTYRNEHWLGMNGKISFSDIYYLSWLEVTEADRSIVFDTNSLLALNPIAYFFAGIGMRIGTLLLKIFGPNFDTAYNLLLLSRLSNYIAYCMIGACAVKRIPCMKKLMMLLLVNPTAFYICTSSSYDAIIFPITLLFAGEVLHLIMGDTKVNKSDIAIVSVCTIFMFAIKMAYAPFLLLLLIVPLTRYESRKQYWNCSAIVVVSAFVGGVLPGIIRTVNEHGHVEALNENVVIQRQYLSSNPQLLPAIITNSLERYKEYYLSGFLGKLGVLDTNYPVPVLTLFLVGLIFVTVIEVMRAGRIPVIAKVVAAVSIFISFVGIFLAMYLDWTPFIEGPMGDVVSGVQGRYFLPIYIFIAMLFASSLFYKIPDRVQSSIGKVEDFVFRLLVIIQPVSVILIVIQRFWI